MRGVEVREGAALPTRRLSICALWNSRRRWAMTSVPSLASNRFLPLTIGGEWLHRPARLRTVGRVFPAPSEPHNLRGSGALASRWAQKHPAASPHAPSTAPRGSEAGPANPAPSTPPHHAPRHFPETSPRFHPTKTGLPRFPLTKCDFPPRVSPGKTSTPRFSPRKSAAGMRRGRSAAERRFWLRVLTRSLLAGCSECSGVCLGRGSGTWRGRGEARHFFRSFEKVLECVLEAP